MGYIKIMDDRFERLCIIIPSYQPEMILVELVKKLLKFSYRQIIVINDGSNPIKQIFFDELAQLSRVSVLTNLENKGKGASIKLGLRYVLKNYSKNLIGVITVDADGQHLPKDIHKISETLLENPQDLILGCREFDKKVPWRSRFGNQLTRILFRLKYHFDLKDTQTGLRGIPFALMPVFSEIFFNRYEYEMQCLIQTIKLKCKIVQAGISTVYIDYNKASHFNPLMDSMRIYYVFMRYAVISFTSFLIDMSLFIIFHLLTKNIFISLFIARVVSGAFNFYQNKFSVYRSYNLKLMNYQIVAYIMLVIGMFMLSYLSISFLVEKGGINVILAKIITDACLFFVSFSVQRMVIFRNWNDIGM